MNAVVRDHNPDHGPCAWRLLALDHLCIPGKFVARNAEMMMNNGSKLLSSADARLKQWKSSRSWSTLTGTQESCTTPSCGPQSLGHVRFFWRFTSATSTVFLVQLALACTRSSPSVCRGWGSSWSIELLFNEARRVSSENLARRLSNLAMWHRAANSSVVEDCGRAPLVVQPEDEAETRGALPEVFQQSEG